MKAALLLPLAFTAGLSHACDGPSPDSPEVLYKKAAAVAAVEIRSAVVSNAGAGLIDGEATVTEVFKGSPSHAVQVRWYGPTTDCWLPVNVGARYLVFVGAQEERIWLAPPMPLSDVPTSLLNGWRHVR